MTRVATADNEALLLTMARQTTAAQLERICRLHRKAARPDGSAETIERDQRFVRARETDDGMVSIQLRLLPEEATRFLAGAEACAESGNLADGTVHMAEAALAGGSTESTESPGPVRTPVETVVHLSAETLTGETSEGDRLEPDTCRRLLCDSGLVFMLEDAAGRTIDVGRKTHAILAALHRALHARDRGCREWGFAIESTTDGVVFRDPAGNVVPEAPPRPRLDVTTRALGDPSISAESNQPGWDGWPVDTAACAEALI